MRKNKTIITPTDMIRALRYPMEMKEIKVDLDIYKILENQRISFEESHNEILHRLLRKGIQETGEKLQKIGGGLTTKGVALHTGTRLRHIAKRSGDRYEAEVVDGGILYRGDVYHSPSQAAVAAAGGSRNGWIFWEYYDEPKNKWSLLDDLRNA